LQSDGGKDLANFLPECAAVCIDVSQCVINSDILLLYFFPVACLAFFSQQTYFCWTVED